MIFCCLFFSGKSQSVREILCCFDSPGLDNQHMCRVGFCPRPVTVVKDLPFGLIGTSYYPPFGTATGWGQFPMCRALLTENRV